MEVLLSPRNNLGYVIIRLGGFYPRMSFLSCIGYVTSNCGMGDALELTYAKNVVHHLLLEKT